MCHELVAEPEPVTTATEHRRQVLIVDDDHDQAETLAHCLRHQGFDATVTLAGLPGLEWASKNHPDVVLLDLRLPDTNGLDVCECLVDSPTTCDIPVIVISGMNDDGIVRRCRAAGCRYYVRKPYDPNVLLTLIESALQPELDC